MKQNSILIIDDNRSVLSSLELILSSTFKTIETLSSPKTLMSKLQSSSYDVLLLDMNFAGGINNGNEGIYWLQRVKELNRDMGIVMFTAYAEVDLAVKCLKLGADDFVVKPWDNAKLISTLKSVAVKHKKSQKKQKEKPNMQVEIIGGSKELTQVMTLIEKVAKTDANVLFTGENGTGKDLFAKYLHQMSLRRNSSYVPVDMGAVAPTLFESELFGHVKGSFTDAHQDKIGTFESANKGTLFLDEIGNIPFELQSKLLVALQNRAISKVGSPKHIPVDIRLVTATNSDIDALVMQGKFREDLLYRINTIHIEIPPLRSRGQDIIELANFFLTKFAEKYEKEIQLSTSAKSKLLEHSWPGNVRELEHCIEKAVILCDGILLEPSDFYFRESSIQNSDQPETIEEMERRAIQNALQKCDGNYSLVAIQLGISRQTLYNKIKKYKL